MSLYNQILGTHPFMPHLLALLRLQPDCGRLRDAYLKNENELVIVIFTRNGGANREYYEEIFNSLRKHQNYKYDYDDDYDSTYAYIEFSLDEKIFPIAEENFSITPEERGIKLFQHVMENINDKNNPFVAKALDVGRSIIEKINSAESDILEV